MNKSYLCILLLLSSILVFTNCEQEAVFEEQQKKSPYQVSLNQFKEQTSIYNLNTYLKELTPKANSRNTESLTFEDFDIDTTSVLSFPLSDNRPSFSFKMTLKENAIEGENYNLFIRQIDDEWFSSIFLFVDDTDTTNDTRFSTISEIYTEDGIVDYNRSRGVWAETTIYHCTNTGPCASGVCDLCYLCVSTSATYISITSQGDFGDDMGGGTENYGDGGVYNEGGGGGSSSPSTSNVPEEDEDDDCDTSKKDLKKVFTNISDSDAELLASVINDKGKDFGINSDEDLWHFLSQAGHEVGGFNNGFGVEESTNYTTKARLLKIFSKYYSETDTINKRKPDTYVSNPSGHANYVYCCRMGNGNEESGDGYKFRGRGIFQLTGKTNYTNFKTWYNNKYDPDKDFVANPELLKDNDTIAILSALWYYKTSVLDKIAIDSTTTVKKVTKKVNGGTNGLSDRKEIFTKAKDSIECN